MRFFLDTTETIPEGVGFSLYGGLHLLWLALFLLCVALCCAWYKRSGPEARKNWRRTVAALLVADEVFKVVMLLIGGRFTPAYLPLHLCSINIFTIALHSVKPNKTLDNFLYLVCIPGALAALLFPTWTSLPPANFMHLHSFTVHILLALYPLVLTLCGDIRPEAKAVPRSLLLLVVTAVPALIFNLLFDTNFMFLMDAEAGNPLALFEALWGSHLYGFPILIAAVLLIMYLPILIMQKRRSKTASK